MFNRKYIFNPGLFSIAMLLLVYQSVSGKHRKVTCFKATGWLWGFKLMEVNSNDRFPGTNIISYSVFTYIL